MLPSNLHVATFSVPLYEAVVKFAVSWRAVSQMIAALEGPCYVVSLVLLQCVILCWAPATADCVLL